MSHWTTLTVARNDMDTFRRMADRLRVSQHKLFGAVVRQFSQLTREQQECELGFADPASPSIGDAKQSANPATAKQAPRIHPSRPARRRAG